MTARQKRLAWAAVLVAAATASSRVVGMVREMLTGYYYGADPDVSTWTSVAVFPNLIRSLLADAAISAAFVPVFMQLLVKGERERANKLASALLSLVVIVIGALVLVLVLGAPLLIKLVYPRMAANHSLFDLAVTMTRIVMPTVLLLCAAGVIIGILYSFERFVMPAVISIVWNLVIIGFLVFLAPHWGIHALVWGTVAGTVAELALLLLPMRGLGYRYRFTLDFKDPYLRRTLLLMFPVTITLGILNFNSLIDTVFAWFVSPHAASEIYYAFRLYQLPQGVFAIAIGTVLFPSMARFAATGDLVGFRTTLNMGTRQIFFITIPFATWFIAMPDAFVRLIYQHGVFQSADAASVSGALLFFSVGMAFANGNIIMNRGFQSLQKPWLPLWVSLINLALNALLDLVLYKPMGVNGITLGTSIVASWNFIALVYLMRRHVSEMGGRSIYSAIARMAVCAAALGAVSWLIWWGLRSRAHGLGSEFLVVGFMVLAGGAAYLVAARLLHLEELDLLRTLLRRRRGGPPPGDAPQQADLRRADADLAIEEAE
jgi:putative peptidoglycan lipid II flippase